MKKIAKAFLLIVLLFCVVLSAVVALKCYRPTRWSLDKKTTHITFDPTTDADEDISYAEKIRHVVLISIDTCRADHLSCYSYSRKTSPNIDKVAAEGVLFNHAVSPVPITFPAHTSMLTGTIPPYHKVRDNNNYRLSESNVTLAEHLKQEGFATGAVVGAVVLGSQFGLAQGFDAYDDNIEGEKEALDFVITERSAQEVTQLGNTWLDQHADEKTFLFLHYYDPHSPYVRRSHFTLPIIKHIYDDEIRYTDHYIGKVIAKLKELGIYDSTLLIVAGDHGEGLGDHSESTHSFFIYHSTLHVPLIMKIPGGPNGLVNETVGLIDIVPTVCGLLGIDAPAAVQGKDLSGYFTTGSQHDDETRFYYCESLAPTQLDAGPFLGLVSDNWKYIHTSEPELYDLKEDPGELKNLLEKERLQAGIMQQELKAVIEDDLFKRITVTKNVLDDATRQQLQSLGYVAGDSVDDDIQFEQTSISPKELIEIFDTWEKVVVLMAEEKFEKAKKLCRQMLEDRPDIRQPYFHLGQMAAIEGDTLGIINCFSAFLGDESEDPTVLDKRNKMEQYAKAHTNIGAVFAKEKKFNQALKHYQKALYYNPDSVKANYNVAGVYLRQGRSDKAIQFLQKTLEIDPEMPEANHILGDIRLKQGRLDEAIEHYQAVLNSQPDFEPVLKSLNTAKEQLGKNAALLEKSLEQNPDQPQLHNQLSVLYFQKGNVDKAIGHWNESVRLKPDQPLILNNLAWILSVYPNEEFHNPQEAVQLAEKACELTDDSEPEFLDTLSIAYAVAGDFDKAVETAEKALALEPANKEIPKRLELFKAEKAYSEKR